VKSAAIGSSPVTAGVVDVLFGQAYFLRFDPKLWEAQQPYAPLGALYAAACVRQQGYRVALFDAMLAASETEWAEALDRHRPRFAVIYEDSFNYLSKMCLLRMRQAALTMIDAARARGIPTLVAGSDASDRPSIYLGRGAAAVIAGEGELTLVAALDALAGRSVRALAHVQGLHLCDASGAVHRTPRRDIIRDLDALPRPAWDLIDVERYRTLWRDAHGYHSMNLATTRGCPYHCNWCAKPIYGQRYTSRSPDRVVEELLWLKRTYRPDHISMADDIFGLKPGWIEQFASLARERDAVIPFKCLLRADQVTSAVVRALRSAGCRTVWIGAESGSQRILDAMEKGIGVAQIAAATAELRAAGIEVGLFLQFGYPGETREDIELTLRMVRQCRPDDIGISVSYPLPGTPFFARVEAQLGQQQNWRDSEDLAMLFGATYEPDFYRVLHTLVHAEFRARKSARVLARAAFRPWALRRHLREAAGLVYHGLRVPILRRRLDRFTPVVPPAAARLVLPVLSAQAAAMPTDQALLS
jgi:anaerobic magnesium-protoporphyrin IX monomethyl ester cyclase